MSQNDFPPIPKGAKGPPPIEPQASGAGDDRNAPGGYLGEGQKGGGGEQLGPDGYPIPPKNAKGPPPAEYGQLGEGKDDREPPGGYLGERDDEYNGYKGGGKRDNNGDDESNKPTVKPPTHVEPDPTEPNYSADVWDYIHYAASRADSYPYEIAKRIREGNLNARGSTTSYTPLHVAVKFGQLEAVRQLIKAGANVFLLDVLGQSPLSLACCFEVDYEIYKLLVNGRSDLDSVDKYTWTPLFWAAYKGYYNVVQLLVDRGASGRVRDKRGRKPYDVAATPQIQNLLPR